MDPKLSRTCSKCRHWKLLNKRTTLGECRVKWPAWVDELIEYTQGYYYDLCYKDSKLAAECRCFTSKG